jgi:hypothetical protein
MENDRQDNTITKHVGLGRQGFALVQALVIMLSTLLLVGGVLYLLRGSWRIAVLNKQFATVQEAAAGGVEHTSEVIRRINGEYGTSNMGILNTSDATNVIFYCIKTTSAQIGAKTADGKYEISVTLKCLGQNPIPGGGGALVFPPPPALGSGGGLPSFYVYYSISSSASSTDNNTLGKVEAVYRFAR